MKHRLTPQEGAQVGRAWSYDWLLGREMVPGTESNILINALIYNDIDYLIFLLGQQKGQQIGAVPWGLPFSAGHNVAGPSKIASINLCRPSPLAGAASR